MFQAILKNSILQWAGKFIGLVFGFITTIIVIRYLGDTQYGYFTTVMAYLHFAVVLIDLGLYFILVKRISDPKDNPEKITNNIFTLRLTSGLAALGIFSFIVWFLPYPEIVKQGVLITALNFLFILLIQVLTAVFQKHLKMTWVAIAETSSKIILFTSTIAVVYYWQTGLQAIFVTVVLAAFVNFIILFIVVQRLQKIKLAFNFKLWKNFIKESWPMGLSIAFSLAYFKGDTFLLSLLKSPEEVGVYGAVYKILEVLVTIPVVFVGLALPILSKHFLEKNKAKFQEYLQKSFDFLSYMAFPMIATTLFIAHPLMRLITGDKFTDQQDVLGYILMILIFAVALIFFNTLFSYLVVTVNKQKSMLLAYLFTAVSSLLLYLIFIPKYSYYGAAGVTIYSELMILVFSAWFILRATKIKLKLNNFFYSLLASAAIFALLYFICDKILFIQF